MSALNFDKWWDGEGKESNKWLSEKGVAKKAWNAAIKAKEAGEQRLTTERLPFPCNECYLSEGCPFDKIKNVGCWRFKTATVS